MALQQMVGSQQLRFAVNLHFVREDEALGQSGVQVLPQTPGCLLLEIDVQNESAVITGTDDNGVRVFKCSLNSDTECCCVGKQCFVISLGISSVLLQFKSQNEFYIFSNTIKKCRQQKTAMTVFHQRTEEASTTQYFQCYGCLSQQQNIMQDFVRTATYHRAMLQNQDDFKGKVVLDVGCGSGILSFFAVQAGAKKVYAVEASPMAQYTEVLVKMNNLSDKITVLAGKIEEVSVPEAADIIISESMGYMLFSERMLEHYLHAKKWLKPKEKRDKEPFTPWMYTIISSST